jgi:predicted  nucleic acid-binding Zn-ribbon protein
MSDEAIADLQEKVVQLQDAVESLRSRIYRLEDDLRDVGYRADDALRAAQEATR